jgi:hypothetical protein
VIERDRLLQAAVDETGLLDFGDEGFRQPLDLLIDALNGEARLNDFGRFRAEYTISAGLCNRLKIHNYLQQHPEVENARVDKPIFIVGLPRTGTTALHHMLNQDDSNHTLRLWEAQNPVPPPESASYDSDPRIAKQREGVSMTETFLPGFMRTHLIDAEEPDECYMLLNRNFMSVEYSAMFHIPTYANWLYANLAASDSYAYHKQQLQLLQSKRPGGWVLKAPFHQLGLRNILWEYPDAIIVQTHRAPMSFVASGCSFSELLRKSGSDHIDRPAFPGQFVDMRHDDFVADPWSTIEEIYARRGAALGLDARSAMEGWITANPKGKHGKHSYHLEDYGISRNEVEELFSDYVSRYDLPMDV